MSEVILKPVDREYYTRNPNKTPQNIVARNSDSAKLLLRSEDYKTQQDKTKLIVSTIKNNGDIPEQLFDRVTKISVSSVGVINTTPNINVRNNEITFYSSVTNNKHTVTLTEGFYQTTTDIIDHVVTKLNTLTGATGLTFSKATIPNRPDCYYLNSAGGNYKFVSDCSAIVKGSQLYALPVDNIYSNSKFIGTMGLYYSGYIDFCSRTLTKFSKIQTQSTGYANNLIYRLYIIDPTKPLGCFKDEVAFTHFAYDPREVVTSIDITLYDEFGDRFYVPNGFGFDWSIELILQV